MSPDSRHYCPKTPPNKTKFSSCSGATTTPAGSNARAWQRARRSAASKTNCAATCSTFVNELTEADFDAEAPKAKPGGAKQGMLLYQVPHLMALDEETHLIVRIALDRDVLFEDLKIIDHTEERLLKKISKTMQVELADRSGGRNFSIRSTSKACTTKSSTSMAMNSPNGASTSRPCAKASTSSK